MGRPIKTPDEQRRTKITRGMTIERDLDRRVCERIERTGETYTAVVEQALQQFFNRTHDQVA